LAIRTGSRGTHVFLDAHTRSNVVAGKSGTVKDLGQDNVIAGPDSGR
jgi:hypothetical protein